MRKKVLIIDDQPELWEQKARDGLKDYGIDVVWRRWAEEALSGIRQCDPAAVMLDIRFPEGRQQGKETLEEIKKKHPQLPVMMITATMAEDEYNPEDYALADYRYSKDSLESDYEDLAHQLEKIITKAKAVGLREDTKKQYERYGFIVGKTKAMQAVAEIIEKVADQDTTVLITGESGTGKGRVAEAIHKLGKRAKKPFVTAPCTVPTGLLESEIFGHKKGAFTGAIADREGRIEAAGDGTVFLDEIGEIPMDIQVKLLQFLQDRTYARLGDKATRNSGARIVAATNRDLKAAIRSGQFREDLYYRLNVVNIRLPPLRERKQDIPDLFRHFVSKINEKAGWRFELTLRADVREKLMAHSWPGNIRDFENAVERAMTLSMGDENMLMANKFDKLGEEDPPGLGHHLAIDEVVERIFKKEMGWKEVRDQFGARGDLRTQIIQDVIGQWNGRFGRRPTSEDLAGLLGVSHSNMRRILSECRISLKEIS